jgi:DNA-binding NtrC family response regulator
MLAAIAPTDAGVLLTGERGTGKSLVARAIHARSSRALQPFLAVNCAAIAPSLVASELFGHEKNAFPGATEQKRGLLELAHGGTLYLMEVGELPSEAQATILRVLEGHGFSRMGGTERIHADVRLLGSTTHDLEKEMQAGKIKKELYWNLATTVLKLPALRDRRDDVPRLVRFFLEQEGGRASGIVEDHIAPELLQSMTLAPWPGNVAELRVAVEQMLLLAGTARITAEHWKK